MAGRARAALLTMTANGALALAVAVLCGVRLFWWVQLAMAAALIVLSVGGLFQGPAAWLGGYLDGLDDRERPAPPRAA